MSQKTVIRQPSVMYCRSLRCSAVFDTGSTGDVISVLSGGDGLESNDAKDVDAAIMAISSCMASIPESVFYPVLSIVREKLDR